MDLPVPDHQLKVPVVYRPGYTLSLERATMDHTFIHCDVYGRWNKTLKAKLSADFATLRELHGSPFFAVHDPMDHKHLKFLLMFGFHHALAFTDNAGRPQEIFKTL